MTALAKFLSLATLLGAILCGRLVQAEPAETAIVKTLPAEEQAIKDTVDHWGLPFSDQLRRFFAARDAFRSAAGPQAPKDFFVGIQHSLEKVAKNKYWFKGRYGATIELAAARNESESVQIAVLPDLGKRLADVTLSAGELRSDDGRVIPAGEATIYRVGYIQTPTVLYPTLYSGLWPDSLLPNAAMDISGADLGLFWVDVHVPRDAAAGMYRGQWTLKAGEEAIALSVRLRVRNFTIPDRVPFPIAVWTSPLWPDRKRMTRDEYRLHLAEFLRHGLDPVSVGKEDVSLAKNDFGQFDENIEYCLARGMQRFEVPNPGPAPEKLRPLVEHLRAKGWIDRAIVYSNQDEPTPAQFVEKNVPFFEKMHSLYPDLRVYLASEYHPNIDGGCNIWMTDLSTGQGPEHARQHRGKAELWFYYCHLPIHIDYYRPLVQAPNMEIDNEAIEHRLALWLAWKYQTPGMFIWAGNQDWHGKAAGRDWEKTGWKLTEKPAGFPYGGVHNGNGYLLYPGPYPSVRLKVLRDGLEDYQYLVELKTRAAKSANKDAVTRASALVQVPGEVLMGPHYFNRDPSALLQSRQAMADCIEALGE